MVPKHLSAKLLKKASSKLNVVPDQLERCLQALAILFLEVTKQLKSYNRVLTSLEMLRIPHAEQVTRYWAKEVQPVISKKQLEINGYSQVPKKRVYSFIPNKKVGLLF